VPRRLRSRSDPGFTLLELIVVVVIIGVAAGIVAPAVGAGARQREVRTALQHFVSAVRRASSLAIFRREPVELWVWPDEAKYAVVSRLPKDDGDEIEGEPVRRVRALGDGSDEEDQALAGRKVEAEFRLPEIGSFGEVEGGKFEPETLHGGRYSSEDVVVYQFFPTGSCSGGRIELEFETSGRRKQSYVLDINPLVSSISMEEED
jgi:type II secretion system protein H